MQREKRGMQRVSALDEDVVFGQQVAAILKRLNRLQRARLEFKFCNCWKI